MKKFAIAALMVSAGLAHAQNQAIPNAPASAAKKELVQRLLTLQQVPLENLAKDMVENPARQMAAEAEQVLQTRVAPEKREAAVKVIQEQFRKYGDESSAVVKDRATKIGQASLSPMIEEKFSEDELRQLLASLEAPAYKKFQQIQGDMTQAYVQALAKDLQPVVEPKLRALGQGVASALGVPPPGTAPTATPSAPAKAAKPAAAAASKPAKK